MRRQLIWGLLALLCGCVSVPASAGSVVLSWTAPTQNVDGSALTDLEGYNVYEKCGTIDTPFTMIQYVPKAEQSYQHIIPNDGKMCWWSVSAVATSGESVKSNTVSRLSVPETITASFAWAQRAEVPPSMAWSIVQHAYGFTDTSGTVTATFGSATTAGNIVLAFCWDYYPSGTYPSGVAATNDSLTAIGTPVATDTIWAYAKENITGGDTVFTLSNTASNQYQRLWIVEVSGGANTSAVDSNSYVSSTTYSLATDGISTSLASSVANGLMIAIGWDASSAAIPNAGTGFTSIFTTTDSAGDAAQIEYKTLTTATTYSATWTNTGSSGDGIVVAAVILKPASGAAAASLPPVPPQRKQSMMALLAQ